ncbi:MAG: 30S ribosomal protein S20 [Acidobacteriota bacterium]
MANSESAKKRIRQNEKRAARNRWHRSRMRTAIKKLRAAIASGDAAAAQQLLPGTLGLVDHTAQRGVIHANAASRTKSRLTKAVAALG